MVFNCFWLGSNLLDIKENRIVILPHGHYLGISHHMEQFVCTNFCARATCQVKRIPCVPKADSDSCLDLRF